MNNPPAAAWYPDPGNPSLERWWNGVGWTEQTRPKGPPPPGQKRSGAKVALVGCGVVAALCFFALIALAVIGFIIAEAEQEAETVALPDVTTTTTAVPQTTSTSSTAAPSTTTTSVAPSTTTTSVAPETTTTTTSGPLAMSSAAGLEFVRDAILLNGAVPLQARQTFVESLDGRTELIDLFAQEVCAGAQNADDVDDFAGFLRVSELRALLQTGFSEAESNAVLGTMSNSLAIAFCPGDFERLYGIPAR